MSLLVVGSVALDSVETPFGKADNVHRRLGHLLLRVGEPLRRRCSSSASSAATTRWTSSSRCGRAASTWRASSRRRARRSAGAAATATTSTRRRRWRRTSACSRTSARRSPSSSAARRSSSSRTSIRACSSTCCSQVERPKLVACDTMNFWIESRRPDLLELLGHVDLITLNDGEARQLTDCTNLVKAARWIMERGPKHRDHQEGRARRVHVQASSRSSSRPPIRSRTCSIRPAPAIVRRRLHGLPRARRATLSDANLRRAVVYGSAMGSFAVEKFSVQRLLEIDAGRHRGARRRVPATSSRSRRSCAA